MRNNDGIISDDVKSNGNNPLISCVSSDLPDVESYLPFIKIAHRLNRWSNFGELSESFSEKLLAEFGLSGEACVTCNSATAGMSAALIASRCMGSVLVPAFTFPATYGAVRAAGLEPLVMDVDPRTWTIAPCKLDTLLAKTGASGVVLVAPFGLKADFSEHIAICRRYKATIIIDCAAGLGVRRETPCSGPDLFEVFSLHATKPMGIGEGGAIFCAPEAAPLVRSALNFGLSRHPYATEIEWGCNGKLSEFHAAVGLAQLERYKPMIAGRQRFAALYHALLAEFPVTATSTPPERSPWQVFPLLLPDEQLLEKLSVAMVQNGLEVRRYYRPSLSRWPRARLAEPCPVSEHLAACMVALPVRSVTDPSDAEPILSRVHSALAYTFAS